MEFSEKLVRIFVLIFNYFLLICAIIALINFIISGYFDGVQFGFICATMTLALLGCVGTHLSQTCMLIWNGVSLTILSCVYIWLGIYLYSRISNKSTKNLIGITIGVGVVELVSGVLALYLSYCIKKRTNGRTKKKKHLNRVVVPSSV